MAINQATIEGIASFIALIAALTFAYGYVYQISFYSEFGLHWYVNSITISNIALSGASMVVGVFMYGVATYFISGISSFIYKSILLLYTLGFFVFLLVFAYVNANFHTSTSETLDFISTYRFLTYIVAGLGFGLLFETIEKRRLAEAFLIFYTLLVGFFYFLPHTLGKDKAVQIITQKEGAAPKVVSGKYEDWVLLGTNEGQAVLAEFDKEDLKGTSKIAFADLKELDIGPTQRAIYGQVPY